jgi:hypothetical protein
MVASFEGCSFSVSNCTRSRSNACARRDPCWGTSKNVRNEDVSDVVLWLRTDCDDDLSTGVDMSTLPGTIDGWFFYPCLRNCARPRDPKIVALKNISGVDTSQSC